MMPELSSADMTAYLCRDNGKVHVISHVGRVGASAFCAAVEWTWFDPGTAKNDLFDVHAIHWAGITFIVTSFPRIKLREAKRLATQLGLRLADGAPTLLTQKRVTVVVTSRPSRRADLTVAGFTPNFFPGALCQTSDNDRLFTIENDNNSPVYKNSQRDHEAILSAEREIVEVLNRGVRLTPAQIADYLYGSGSFPQA